MSNTTTALGTPSFDFDKQMRNANLQLRNVNLQQFRLWYARTCLLRQAPEAERGEVIALPARLAVRPSEADAQPAA